MDAIGKWLAMMDNMPPATVTFMRFFIQSVLMFLVLIVMGGLPLCGRRTLPAIWFAVH
jgi:hypothetical protein